MWIGGVSRLTVLLLFFFYSAGVGRTGVFITLSIVLERMQYEGVIDLFQTVRILRTQRPAMVQTEVSIFVFDWWRMRVKIERGNSNAL